MKRIVLSSVAVLSVVISHAAWSLDHWTAELGKLTIFENHSAYVIVSNVRNGAPSTWTCSSDVVYLGVKNATAPKEMLAQAMMIYAAGKTMRFGIRGSGASCEAEYITAE